MSRYTDNPITTLVRHAVRGNTVGVVIACMPGGGTEYFRFQIHCVGSEGMCSMDTEKVGHRDYVMGEFEKFLATKHGVVIDDEARTYEERHAFDEHVEEDND